MKVLEMSEMKGGWFIGDFEPTIFPTKDFEVGVKTYFQGEYHAPHYHKIATEINYLISGKIIANEKEIIPGQIFIFEPYEIAECEFLEDTQILVVKVPSAKGDKYETTDEKN
jgi:quercetin dioxygenase-like cupin family protein